MKNDKFYVDIIKATIIILIAAVVFYWVCPKYDFHRSSTGQEGYIINKVTGDLYLFNVAYRGIMKLDVDWKTEKQFRKENKEKNSQEENWWEHSPVVE